MFIFDTDLIIKYAFPGKRYACFGDPKNYTDLIWEDAENAPTEQAMLDAELPAAKAWCIAKTKEEAMPRIYADYPAWKQSNCALGFYDESETAAIKAGIQAVRTAQAASEVAINALTDVAAVIAFTW